MDKIIHGETGFEIAVVGMSGRFPGAKNLDEFWENLKKGKESIKFFTDEELREYDVDEESLTDSNYVKAKGYLEDTDKFDARFFGYTPEEALSMDPQIRIFHECVWHALENAGCYPETYRGQIGLYAGGFSSQQWQDILRRSTSDGRLDFATDLISSKDMLTTRVSYNLGLTGPSFSLNTMCSTSLVAIHLASNALIAGECEMALAGGVSFVLPPKTGFQYVNGFIISPDGHCRPFDEKASGTIWGDGVGVVALKRLRNAVRDGDRIHAIVKGSAINNDGKVKTTYTSPSVTGQSNVIKTAQQFAEVSPDTIEYVEAHGTGTSLGDPIEIEALKRCFDTDKKQFCGIGSVKSNLGHLAAAAGVASFIKAVLTLKNKQIPPSINYETPNPKIDFKNSPFYVANELRDWDTEQRARRAAVSSFGIGGTNAHVILEESLLETTTHEHKENKPNVLVVSAHSKKALEILISNYRDLASDEGTDLTSLAFSSQTTRKPLNYRKAIPFSERDNLLKKLSRGAEKASELRAVPQVVFMFPGAGAQYFGMCRGLYHAYEGFKTEFDQCNRITKEHFGVDIYHLIFNSVNAGQLNCIYHTLLTLLIIEYALAKFFMSLGVKPAALIGHSSGEYTAAVLAGVLTLEDAIRLVEKRGKLMMTMEEGSMISVWSSPDELQPYLNDKISVACLNSSALVTLSGRCSDVDALYDELEQNGFSVTKIHAATAGHSDLVEPIIEEFVREVSQMKLSAPTIPYVSNLTGTWITSDQATDPAYYGRHLRESVQFEAGIKTLFSKSHNVFMEVGPGNTLSTFVQQHADYDVSKVLVSTIRKPKEKVDDQQKFLSVIGDLWENGVQLSFQALHGKNPPAKVSLPLYPFQGERYWPEEGNYARQARHKMASSNGKSISQRVEDWFYEISWQKSSIILKESLERMPTRWLLLFDEKQSGEQMKHRLEKEGQEVVLVNSADEYSQVNDEEYTIDISQEDHFTWVFRSVHERQATFDVVVNGLMLGSDEFDPSCTDIPQRLLQCFYSNIHIVRGYSTVYGDQDLKLITLTNGAFEVMGNESIDPFQSSSISTIKLIPLEYPAISCTLIDTDGSPEHPENLLRQITQEALAGKESIVAYRNNVRWKQALIQRPPKEENIQSVRIRESGVYVITGGLGILGFKFAEYIQNHENVRLALLTRSAFPEKKSWAEWQHYSLDDLLALQRYPESLGMGNTTFVSAKCQDVYNKVVKLLRLEAMGADVRVFQADLSDQSNLLNCFGEIEKELGSISGVIHGAGFYHYTPIATSAYESMNAIFQPKVDGTLALYRCIKDKPLDFVMLQASLSSVTPLKNFSAYSGANLFLDGFATYLHSVNGLKTIAVNWDIFKSSESEIGVATEEEQEMNQAHVQFVKSGISHEEGRKIFDKLLHEYSSQVIISRNDPAHVLEVLHGQDAETKAEEDRSYLVSLAPRPDLTAPYVAPHTLLEKDISEVWKTVLGFEKVGLNDNFFELGGDSLKGLTLISKLNKKFQLGLVISNFFKDPTISRLVDYAASTANDKGQKSRAIDPTPIKDYYALSYVQKRLYFLYRLDSTSLAYNIPRLVKLEGFLDKDRLFLAFERLIARHEMLRTSFQEVDGLPVQQILPQALFEIEELELKGSSLDEMTKEFIRPFDLSKPPLLRAGVIRITDQEHYLLLDIHHIITDGVSRAVMIRDFMAFYEGQHLPELRIQYKDYAEWQQSAEQQKTLADQREFWKSEFAEGTNVLNLPTDYPRPKVKTYVGSHMSFSIGKEETKKLKELGNGSGATLFMTLVAVFNVLLSKLTHQSDITIGTGVAGRDHADLEHMFGMFVNTIALRNFPKGDLSFMAFLAEVKTKTLACFDNQAYPYEELIEELKIPRDASRDPLVDVMLVFQNHEQEELSIPGLKVVPCQKVKDISKLDLTVSVEEIADELDIELEYSTDLFKRETMERFADYFQQIVKEIVLAPTKKLSEFDFLPDQERHQLLHTFNDTTVDYPLHKTIVELFEEQVERSSSAIAASDHYQKVSYTELNAQANQLAHSLLREGLTREMPIVVLSNRSVDMLAGMLGILKAGGVYVPVSVDHPLSRIEQVLRDARPQWVLTTSAMLGEPVLKLLVDTGVGVICLDNVDAAIMGQADASTLRLVDRSVWQEYPSQNPSVRVAPNQLAYILYTSGSTGIPKGVMIEHRGMLNHLLAKRDSLQLSADSVVAQNASESFDISIWQFFSALLVGGKTVIYAKEQVLEPEKFLYRLQQDRVSVLEVVPSYLSVLLGLVEEMNTEFLLTDLSYLLVTGETLQKKLVERWFNRFPDIKLINAYGPTEASDDVTQCVLSEAPQGTHVPIGHVLPNLRIYVVDEYEKLCPRGVKGQIVVSGVGVGRGYLNEPDKTAAVFVADPFSSDAAQRMYYTGDIGRWLADGSLEFLGRQDQQVKVSGHRIELGEVESGLMSRAEVTEAVVLTRQEEGTVYLVGYYVAEKEVSVAEMRSYLTNRLPGYMMPTYLVPMPAFPLTPNGKVDHEALPDPEITAGQDYVAPSDEVEKALVEIWSELLRVDQEVISVTANFFELGGHSLVATTLVNKISKRFRMEFTLADIFAKQTIKAQAEFIALSGWLLTSEVSGEQTIGITI